MNKKLIINLSIVICLVITIVTSIFVINNIYRKVEEPKAYVYLNNEEIMVIDYLILDEVKTYELNVIDKHTKKEYVVTIGATNIGVWIENTSCRDQICKNTGIINGNTVKPIVCMSVGLTIEVK